ncbi:MAG: saccharopine dehydrogenase NADP-binding domain-containing protein [Pseudomonadota bacterium]
MNRPADTDATQPEFDLVVWGATGFTGRLVAAYLLERYGVGGTLRWAMAGRSDSKLESVRGALADAHGDEALKVPLIVADSHDRASLDALVSRTRVVCSTVGPFAKYGSALVAACVSHGTDYCDITGEVAWIRQMIDQHEREARQSGARIVHCCGFDSIPSDLGTFFVVNQMRDLHGQACAEVKLGVRRMSGEFSGGTIDSMLAMIERAKSDGELRRVLGNPYSLNPDGERKGPDRGDQKGLVHDEEFDAWTAPFVMAAINTRVVRRSNALLDYAYGKAFRYSEVTLTGRGLPGFASGAALSGGLGAFLVAASFSPTRKLMQSLVLPKPGEGPSESRRENGFFDIVVLGIGAGPDRPTLRARVRGDRDPGYGSTSRMIGESAVCLALDRELLGVDGGFWTPASAFGDLLIERLAASAGVTIELEPPASR